MFIEHVLSNFLFKKSLDVLISLDDLLTVVRAFQLIKSLYYMTATSTPPSTPQAIRTSAISKSAFVLGPLCQIYQILECWYFSPPQTDQTAPVFTFCPSNISTTTDNGKATAVITWATPNVTDNSGMVTVTSDIQSGSNFIVAETQVTYTATDQSGNVATCVFTVNVIGELQFSMLYIFILL